MLLLLTESISSGTHPIKHPKDYQHRSESHAIPLWLTTAGCNSRISLPGILSCARAGDKGRILFGESLVNEASLLQFMSHV